ncbi:MAG TPA: hypothetical protein VKB38_14880 [Terracidiphilus sp.]|nr:hypothetical protein [Terracidiphilus sp.]
MSSRAWTAFPTALRMAVPALLLCLPAIAFCSNPTAVSVTPASGAGTVQSFALAYSDSAGVSDLSWVFALFTPNGDGAHACGVYYHPGDNLIYLADDNNTTVLGPGAVGSPGHLSNSQCTIDVGASSTSVSGDTLTVNVAVTFHINANFKGATGVYLYAVDKENNVSGVQKRGAWTVEANTVPLPVSVSPSSGSGPGQVFALTYSDPNGPNDLKWVYAFFAPPNANTDSNTCYFWYHPSDNLIYLADDNGGRFGPGEVGQAGTLRNNECLLDVGATSVSRTLNTLTLNAALNFEGASAGEKDIYMFAENYAGLTSSAQVVGQYTVDFGPLYVASVTDQWPGYQVNQNTFFVTFSDANGGSAINFMNVLFTPNKDGSHACPIYVHMPEGYVYLANDANDAVLGPGKMGFPGKLSNSQCTVDTGNSSANVGATSLQINLPVTFASSFYGPLNIIANAADNAGLDTGLQRISSYTVSAPVAATYTGFEDTSLGEPSVLAYYDDDNGSQDMRTLYILVGPFLDLVGSCYVRYETASNTIYLSEDAGGWRGPGQPRLSSQNGKTVNGVPGSLSNNECTIDTGYSQVNVGSSDPTALYLEVPITYYAAPRGTVLNIYVNAVDNEGNSAGWVLQQRKFVVP